MAPHSSTLAWKIPWTEEPGRLQSAPDCRYPHAHRLLRLAKEEVKFLNADDVNPDLERLGLKGSPTKVKKIDNIVLSHKESCQVDATPEALSQLMATLSKEHIIS